MDMLKVTARWTGFLGAPGYSNFFFAGGGGLITDAQQVADRVSDAFSYIGAILPGGVSVEIIPEVQRIEAETGNLIEYHEIDEVDGTQGSGTGGFSAASGAVVTWLTNDVRFNRRIRGRTFIVPLEGDAYEGDGTLGNVALGNLRAFADALVGGDFDSEFGVWSRPRNGSGGVFATAVGSRVPDMAAVLRSRRD